MDGNDSHGESILSRFFFSFFFRFLVFARLEVQALRAMLKSHIWGIDGGVMFGPPSPRSGCNDVRLFYNYYYCFVLFLLIPVYFCQTVLHLRYTIQL